MAKKTKEELEELEKLRDFIAERIFSNGIDEGYGLDIIINEDKDEEE